MTAAPAGATAENAKAVAATGVAVLSAGVAMPGKIGLDPGMAFDSDEGALPGESLGTRA